MCPPFRTATLVENETIEGQIGEGCRVAERGGLGRNGLVGGEEFPFLHCVVDREGEQQDGDDRQGDDVNHYLWFHPWVGDKLVVL